MIIKKDKTIEEYQKGLIAYKNNKFRASQYYVPIPTWVIAYLKDYKASDKKLKEKIVEYNNGIDDLFIYLYKTTEKEQYMLSMNKLDNKEHINHLKIRRGGKNRVLLTIPKYTHRGKKGIIGSGVKSFDVIFFNKVNEEKIIYFKLIKKYNDY